MTGETCLPICEAAAHYGLDYFQLHKWYRSGHVRGHQGVGRSESELAALADLLPPWGRALRAGQLVRRAFPL